MNFMLRDDTALLLRYVTFIHTPLHYVTAHRVIL